MSQDSPDYPQRIAELEESNRLLQQQLTEAQQVCHQTAKDLQKAKATLQNAQARSSDSEHFLRLAIDRLPQAVFWKDRNSVFLGCNQYAARAANLDSPAEIVGKTDYDFPWKPEEAEFFRACDRRVMESNTPELGIIEPQQRADGSQRWLETNKLPLHDAQGNVIGIVGTFVDITDRVRIETQLKQQAIAMDAATDGIGISTQEGFVYLNQAHLRLFGYDSAEELLGKSWQVLYDDDEVEWFNREVMPLLLRNKSWQGETIAKRKDGSTFPQELSLNMAEDGSFICICRDITQRKQIELDLQQMNEELERSVEARTQALQSSEARLQRLADNVPGVIFQFRLEADGTKSFPYVSEGSRALYELDPEDFLQAFDLVHTLDSDSLKQAIQISARTLVGFRHEHRIITPGGIFKWVQTIARPECQEDDAIVWDGIIIDISDRKQAEEELLLFKRAVESSSDAIALADSQGNLIYQNPAYAQLYQCNTIEYFQSTGGIAACYPDADIRQEVMQAVIKGRSWVGEAEQRSRNGRHFPAIIRANGIKDESDELLGLIGIVTDISNRKQAERELQEQKQLLRSIYDGVSHPIFVADVLEDGSYRGVSYNRAAEEATGLTTAAIAGQSFESIFGREQATAIAQDFDRAVASGKPYAYEECRNFPNGEQWFFTTINPLKDATGRVYRLVGTALNISDRKAAEQALRESEAKYQQILDAITEMVLVKREKSYIVWANKAFRDYYGMSNEELQDLIDASFNNPDYTQKYIRDDTYVFETGKTLKTEELTTRHDGTVRQFSTIKSAIRNEDGEIILTVGVSRDITERKEAEERLRQSEERFRGLVETLNDWIWECDRNGVYTYASPQVKAILGYTAEEMIGKNPFDCMPPEEAQKISQIFAAKVAKAEPFEQLENANLHKDGHLVVLETSGVPIFDAEGNLQGYRGVDRDISERAKLEADRQRQEQALRSIVQGTVAQTGEAFFHACVKSLSIALEVQYVLIAEIANPEVAQTLAFWSGEDFGENFKYHLVGTPCATVLAENQLCRYSHAVQSCFPEDPILKQLRVESYIGMPILDPQDNLLGLIVVMHPEPIEQDLKIETSILEIFAARAGAEIKRMQAEQAVLEKDTLLQMTLAAGKMGCWNWNRNTGEVIWLGGVEGILGLKPGVLGKTFEDYVALIHPEDRETVLQTIEQTLETEQEYDIEHRLVLPDGEICWIRGSGEIWRNDRGESIGLLGSIVDDTRRKIAEMAFIRSAEQIHQQAQQEQLLNQIANQIRNSLDLNSILNTTVREIQRFLEVDRCHFAWYVQNAQEAYWDAIAEVQTPGLPSLIGRHYAIGFGALLELLLRQNILRVDDLSTVADPTVREGLATLGERSMLVLPVRSESGRFGIIACIHNQTVRPWSDTEVDFLEAVVAQLAIALNQAELLTQSQTRAQELEALLTQLQRTQTQLIQSEKMSSLGQLVAGVAHEINNPVTFIYGNIAHARQHTQDLIGLLELYQHHYPQPHSEICEEAEAIGLEFLKEDLQKIFKSMHVGTTRIREIVKSLRTFSRLDEAEIKAVDLHDGIDSTLTILQTRLRSQTWRPEITIAKDYTEALPRIECYAGQLNQVFMNLLSNAIDALEERDRDRTPEQMEQHPSTIQIQTRVIENDIVIRITDNGTGMSEATQARLFDPFFTTKPVGKGTGLGLSISYQVVTEKHQGQLSCTSRPGETTFTIEIPIQKQQTGTGNQ